MQRCRNCNKQFGWSKIYKSFLGWIYKPVECDNSNAEHKITFPGRVIFVSLTILPMLLFVNYLLPFKKYFSTLSVGFTIFMLGSLLVVCLCRFKVASNKYNYEREIHADY